MVGLYVILIKNHLRKFESIGDEFKEAVKAELEKQGYDTDGNKIQNA